MSLRKGVEQLEVEKRNLKEYVMISRRDGIQHEFLETALGSVY